jgi:hypothetical protein
MSVTSVVVLTGIALVPMGGAQADTAPPAGSKLPATVSADPLPTVQIDGVVWSQVIVGGKVYAGGKFTTARPAGSASGTNTVPRNNLLAYDLATGKLDSSFVPNLNGQVLSVTASPDGSRIYVGGDFTRANGQTRNRVAAFSTSTGKLISTFKPSVNGRVRALAANEATVFVGGAFTTVGGPRAQPAGGPARRHRAAAKLEGGRRRERVVHGARAEGRQGGGRRAVHHGQRHRRLRAGGSELLHRRAAAVRRRPGRAQRG